MYLMCSLRLYVERCKIILNSHLFHNFFEIEYHFYYLKHVFFSIMYIKLHLFLGNLDYFSISFD